MQVEAKQISGKPRKIGKLGSNSIWAAQTKGGLHLVLKENGGKVETLGTGPHPAVARRIAEIQHEDIEWTSLQKADYVEPEHFAHLMPEYQALTAAIRKRQGY